MATDRRSGPPPGAELSPEALAKALEHAANLAGIGIVVAWTDGDRIVNSFMNQAIADIAGLTLEEVYGVNTWDALPADERERLYQMHAERLRGESPPARFETAIVRRDGSRIPIEVATTRLEVDGRPCNVSLVWDNSVRRQAENALRESEARLRLIIESAPDGVSLIQDGKYVLVNLAAAHMLGYDDPGDVVGLEVAALLVPDDATVARQRMGRLMVEGRLQDVAEYRGRRRDGREISVEISSVRTEYRGRPAILGFARDVTERKAIQAQLLQADRLAAVGLLSAGVAHEINNPLSYLMLNIEYVMRELPKIGGDAAQQKVDDLLGRLRDATQGAERVAAIVRDLKTFARPPQPLRGPVDLVSVVESALRMSQNELRHTTTVVRDFAQVPSVDGDPARLEQVFINLLTNAMHALQASPQPGSELRVTLRMDANGDVLASVTDTGQGIAPENLSQIFLPFFTTKPAGIGTGLGLSICKSILEALGGDLSVESKLGAGSTFTMRLKPHRPEAGKKASERPSPVRAMGRIRLLVIDDDPALGRTLGLLARHDYDVKVADSAEAAYAFMDAGEQFDAILCDLMMPGTTGMDFYEQLVVRDAPLARKVVFMTGGAMGPRAESFLDTVQNPRVLKPFRIDDVRALIAEAAAL
jgi:PAS domain S-box-containing protein